MYSNLPRMRLRIIEHDSADYDASIELRERLLRRPLGLRFDAGELRREGDCIHLGAWQQNSLTGCVMLVPETPVRIQIRQLCMDRGFRGHGNGSALLAFAEQQARRRGYQEFFLHARANAAGFYRKAGYRARGEVFYQLGIAHMRMTKP